MFINELIQSACVGVYIDLPLHQALWLAIDVGPIRIMYVLIIINFVCHESVNLYLSRVLIISIPFCIFKTLIKVLVNKNDLPSAMVEHTLSTKHMVNYNQ